MLGFAVTLGATIASFIIPSFIGLLLISAAARFVGPRYLAAFAVGLYMWFYSDTIGDASLLGVSEGFTGGIWHVALWACFAVGVVALFSLDGSMFEAGTSGERLGMAVPLLVAVAVGLHGFGEGASIGATAAATPSTNLADAFGGLSAAAAFLIHKCLEPMMVGAAYWVYARDRAATQGGLLKDIAILTFAFSLPGIVGSATAYYLVQAFPGADFTYVFALGLGASIYAAFRLARPMFQGPASRSDAAKIALLVVLGFTCLYLAALLHS
ncbi:MAG TPA: hypothetical protein VLX56_07240 [Nitrososphaerales archaeon]|nr:hypothetical protein [Nitrososphaerales archaeon]